MIVHACVAYVYISSRTSVLYMQPSNIQKMVHYAALHTMFHLSTKEKRKPSTLQIMEIELKGERDYTNAHSKRERAHSQKKVWKLKWVLLPPLSQCKHLFIYIRLLNKYNATFLVLCTSNGNTFTHTPELKRFFVSFFFTYFRYTSIYS